MAPFLRDLIGAVRKALDLTQEELARQLGVTVKSVSNYENGARRPEDAVIHRLVAIAPEKYKLPLADYLHDDSASYFAIPVQTRETIQRMAQAASIPLAKLYAEVIEAGLEAHAKRIFNPMKYGPIPATVSQKLLARVQTLAKKKNVDPGMLLSEAIEVGLEFLSSPASSSTRPERLAHLDRVLARLQHAKEEVREQSQRGLHRESTRRGKKGAA